VTPPIEATRERSSDRRDPPRMLSVSMDVVPGNDLDAINCAIIALDEAHTDLRTALLHQRSGEASEVVREFWKRNRGLAFRATCALLVIDPEDDA
jgi:hypothetical protein